MPKGDIYLRMWVCDLQQEKAGTLEIPLWEDAATAKLRNSLYFVCKFTQAMPKPARVKTCKNWHP